MSSTTNPITNELIPPISDIEVKDEINRLPSKKSPGSYPLDRIQKSSIYTLSPLHITSFSNTPDVASHDALKSTRCTAIGFNNEIMGWVRLENIFTELIPRSLKTNYYNSLSILFIKKSSLL